MVHKIDVKSVFLQFDDYNCNRLFKFMKEGILIKKGKSFLIDGLLKEEILMISGIKEILKISGIKKIFKTSGMKEILVISGNA